MKAEDAYLQNLRTIEQIARSVARKHRLNPDEAAEFTQEVRVHLLEDDYAVFRKFEGRSSLSTYLHTVIKRFHSQWRVKQWGKWRPSAEAKRLGRKAIDLERLLTRDGYTFEEAVRELTTPAGSEYTIAELEAIYLRLPPRVPRPIPVSDELLPESVAADGEADELVEARDRERAARYTATTLDRLFQECGAEDQLILQMRFWDERKVPDIARTLHMDQKKVYKRLDKLYLALRRGLEKAGVSKSEVALLLARGDQEIRFGIVPEIPPPGPSQSAGGKGVRRREGRAR
ncbi:MAG TPA: sigma-70 family RNA polymerase sigma factor [Thermoanaerobaculia bacterium]|nr:sigma-70 family RNA polymerase sigma factor [Thermoanaerobaculia bacterium]